MEFAQLPGDVLIASAPRCLIASNYGLDCKYWMSMLELAMPGLANGVLIGYGNRTRGSKVSIGLHELLAAVMWWR